MIRWIGVVILLIAVAPSVPSLANVPGQTAVAATRSHGLQITADDQEPNSENSGKTQPSEDEPATPDQMGAPGSEAHDCAAACDARCNSLGSPELTVQCRRNCAGRCLAPVEK